MLGEIVTAIVLLQIVHPPELVHDGSEDGSEATRIHADEESFLSSPEWLQVSGYHRTQYESLRNQFRRGTSGDDQGLFFRTGLQLTLRPEIFEATFELMDARQTLDEPDSVRNTGQVNALEPVQFYAGLHLKDVLAPQDTLFVQGGRFTMDVGSRRLVGRHIFRQTYETFTGVNGVWTTGEGHSVQAFWTIPVRKAPSDASGIADNDIVFDEERNAQFWGLYGTLANVFERTNLEVGVFGLHEDSGRDREILTPNIRLRSAPKPGHWDFESDTALQFGTSRLSASGRSLDHFAYFQHLELGYTLEAAGRFRSALVFDYASGDKNPTDGDNNRFDTLFGVRRPDTGPTGIYGPFARANLISPGVLLTFQPAENWNVMLFHRGYWLADESDAFVAAGLQDPTGRSGRYLGQQPEVRVRWDPFPGRLRLEAGAATIVQGDYFRDVPLSNGEGDAVYGYFSVEVRF